MVCYSSGMETMTAPDLTPGYPSKGARLGPAWADVWAELTKHPGQWHDGATLWEGIAPTHDLAAVTLRGLMFRMSAAGHLESEPRMVKTARGFRSRTQFRYVKKGTVA